MIKYHDNINGVQYGADHILTNNWNPDCDYGNEYVNIHFRIETNGYGYIGINASKVTSMKVRQAIMHSINTPGGS